MFGYLDDRVCFDVFRGKDVDESALVRGFDIWIAHNVKWSDKYSDTLSTPE